ncbi:cupin domain-containing protein [Rhodococcus xishaensis]|uniref:Cupin domain-containing protein n=1 Tax=Rhodococcus xishaensis TaxID=2487364 RepID=A0A438ANW9_9NOCA|nr:cupin domain-containing protein [Rhodococcus xishaensis]RVW00616.1 cupin domain-containing protein [Rhodococcus xishaensis]
MRLTYILAVAATVMALDLVPATASATPGEGVAGETLAEARIGDKDYILTRITIAPGGTTGWHYHDGEPYGIITEGTLTHYASDCAIDGIYNAGDTLIEPSGSGYVHMARNLGSVPMVLLALFVNPVGSPLSHDVPPPNCAQSP